MRLLLFCLSLFGVCAISSGCSCLPNDTNFAKYCRADFAATVYLRSGFLDLDEKQDFDNFYRMDIQRIWKSNFHGTLDVWRLYTGSNSAMCGLTGLKSNTAYFITGSIDRDRRRYKVNSCNAWIIELGNARRSYINPLLEVSQYKQKAALGRCPN